MADRVIETIFKEAYQSAIQKTIRNSKSIGVAFPQVAEDGFYNRERASYWTGGFWGGLVWLAYRAQKTEGLFELACEIEAAQDGPLNEYVHMHHDVGFMWLPTAVFHHRTTGCQSSKVRGMKAAGILASRFNLNGRFIRAWDSDVRGDSQGFAIIDCLMNLPLLYWASKELNDPRFKQIACAHTDTALQYFVREDFTVPHIMSFDADTGSVIGPVAGQGKGLDSVWSRGQAWAIYGFAIGYRETGDQRYLDTACAMAKRFYHNLPEDGIPYWDFCSEEKDRYARDSSAACIAASGILEIAGLVSGEEDKEYYLNYAKDILRKIIQNYACFDDSSQGIVSMGTVNYISNRHINMPIIYGDFYFVEALGKLHGLPGVF